jgi:DNA polymerase-3 subunit delta
MLHALDLIEKSPIEPAGFIVLFGEDRFLHLEAARHLVSRLAGDHDPQWALSPYDGDTVAMPDVMDALATGSLFASGGRRMVLVDEADEFVKLHRSTLEEWAEHPTSNTLLLHVNSWPGNTRLYKLVEKNGLAVDCNPPQQNRGKSKAPDERRIMDWLVDRAQRHHGYSLSKAAARQLFELSPCHFGLLDQQLAKLACCTTEGQTLTPENVRDWIGGWRMNTIWQTIDAVVDGETAKALELLHRLFQSGEHPLALLGQISWSLRRYGEVLELYDRAVRRGQRPRLADCLAPAGFRPWGGELAAAETRIKRLGQHRTRRILRWLLETDLALKGTHSHETRGRFALERMIVRLSLPNPNPIAPPISPARSAK